MIKLPEPVAWRTSFNNGKRWVPTDVEAISDARHGLLAEPLYTEAQLKQAVRDAYGEAAKKCDEYAELCEREQGQTTLYGHIRASAAQVLALEVRALIKEIPE
jgi:hypothetical protein